MFSRPWKILLYVTILTIAALPADGYAAGRAQYQRQSVQVFINKDGSFDVVDSRTYSADPKQPIVFEIGSSELTGEARDISISGSEQSYRLIEQSDALIPGTYQLSQTDTNTVRIALRCIEDEAAAFALSYQVLNGIQRYLDTADLRWVLGASGERRPSDLTVLVTLPESSTPDTPQAWLHFSERATVLTERDQIIRMETSDLPSDTPLSIRLIFPTEDVQGEILPLTVRAAIESQESESLQSFYRLQDQKALIRRLGVIYFSLFQPAVLAGWLYWFYRYYSRQRRQLIPAVPAREDIWNSPFTEREAAAVPYLTGAPKEQLRTLTVLSTFFDLLGRGHLRIEEQQRVLAGLRDASHTTEPHVLRIDHPQTADRLTRLETVLIQILFPGEAQSTRVPMTELVAGLRRERRRVTSWTAQGKKLAALPLQQRDTSSTQVRWLYLSAGLLTFVGSPVILLAVVLLPLLSTSASRFPTDEKTQWIEFKEALGELRKMTHAPTNSLVDHWQHILPLALACDAAEGFLDLLPDILAHSSTMPAWYTRSGEVTLNTADISAFPQKLRDIISRLSEALEPGRSR